MTKKIIKRNTSAGTTKPVSGAKNPIKLQRSKLEIFDIPDDLLIDSPDNPQEMDDATFDELVEGIRAEGVDEPMHVIRMYGDDGEFVGTYMITSGHHRRKAGRAAGISVFPCVIKKDMDDAARKIALVRRNQLRGSMNSKKFTALFREVSPVLGPEMAKRLMGFTKEAAFKKVFDDVRKSLPSDSHKKALDDAKETVKSVDDLSSILHGIFKREGSKVTSGYMVFSFEGKKHHYFQVDKNLSKKLEDIEAEIGRRGISANQYFEEKLLGISGVAPKKSKPKVRIRSNGA